MSDLKKIIIIILSLIPWSGCLSDRHIISQRPMGDGLQNVASSREVTMPPSAQDVYTKQRVLNFKPVKKANTTGSLVTLDDPRSYTMASMAPLAIGNYLTIKTVTNADAAKAAAPGANGKSGSQTAAQMEQDLLKSLPTLDPAPGEKDKPQVVPGFKMEVVDILDNGDAIVAYHRRSVRGDQAGDVLVKARIPQAALMERENLSTGNLVDVDFRESKGGELSERTSTQWEDEYTLRMSGFDEARSKSAVALDEQRRQIKDTRDKLATQIKSFSTERQTVAKERADLVAKEKADAEKLKDMEQKIKDQESEIEKLKPKEEEKLADDAPAVDDPKAKDAKAKAGTATPAKPGSAPATASKPATQAPKPVALAKPAAPSGDAKK